MNTERLIKMVISDFTSDLLRLEDELEKYMNKEMDAVEKSLKIRTLLKETCLTEQAFAKFQKMIINNTQNKQQDGQV